jgi:glycosyltransferase involved in cell wall biosynthesis
VRAELGLNSENVAVYTGGLYPNKRIDFLLDAAILIREAIPDFELIVIGDGPDRHRISAAASRHPWIHDIGPKNDQAKVPYWALAKLLLMPGLVGLVVVDSFALGVPLITTDFPYHSPEIDYLKNDINGLLVPCGPSAEIYATAVATLLLDPPRLERLRTNALASAAEHTIEKMADNFAMGVIQALEQPRA